jgi:hypothetical protein
MEEVLNPDYLQFKPILYNISSVNWRLILHKRNANPRKSYVNGRKERISKDFEIFFCCEFSVDADEISGITCGKPGKDKDRFSSAPVLNLKVILIKTGPITPVNDYWASK